LDSILRALLYGQFTETLTGLPIIRAYPTIISTNEQYLDNENRAYFLYIAVSRWLGVRLESIANVLIYIACLLAVLERFQVDPSIVGVILSYSMIITADFSWCIKQFADVEATMNSVERLLYCIDNVEGEADLIIPEHRPPPEWPSKGEIVIKDLEIRYGPENPPVIKGISLTIKGSEKIGIVGRTGCGKSTFVSSFFRINEPSSGKIIIDGIDISSIGLKDLRSKITIIPQDPVLFNGTI
ncbi:11311_t:CDS:2, partial [Acaulospora colombiana]